MNEAGAPWHPELPELPELPEPAHEADTLARLRTLVAVAAALACELEREGVRVELEWHRATAPADTLPVHRARVRAWREL